MLIDKLYISMKRKLRAFLIRLFKKKSLVRLKLEITPSLFDVVVLAGQQEYSELLYVGKGFFMKGKSFIKPGGYPKVKVTGNFLLSEVFL